MSFQLTARVMLKEKKSIPKIQYPIIFEWDEFEVSTVSVFFCYLYFSPNKDCIYTLEINNNIIQKVFSDNYILTFTKSWLVLNVFHFINVKCFNAFLFVCSIQGSWVNTRWPQNYHQKHKGSQSIWIQAFVLYSKRAFGRNMQNLFLAKLQLCIYHLYLYKTF